MFWRISTAFILVFWAVVTGLMIRDTHYPNDSRFVEVPVRMVFDLFLAEAVALNHPWIIDEPMIGHDPIHARVVKEELRWQSRAGAAVLMSTHLLHIAEEVADRIGIIHRGKLLFVGSLEELRAAQAKQGLNLEAIFLEMVSESQT
jgi:ABC-type Na+ transport system ATPase subunit NatA